LPTLRRLAPADNRALACAAAFTGHVLIAQSEHDNVIPPMVIDNYVGALGAARSVRHEVLWGADHGLSRPARRQAYGRLLATWLAGLAASSAPPATAERAS